LIPIVSLNLGHVDTFFGRENDLVRTLANKKMINRSYTCNICVKSIIFEKVEYVTNALF